MKLLASENVHLFQTLDQAPNSLQPCPVPPLLRLRQAQLSAAVKSAESAPLTGKAAWERATGTTDLQSRSDDGENKVENCVEGRVDDYEDHQERFLHSVTDQRVPHQGSLVNAPRCSLPPSQSLKSRKGALKVPTIRLVPKPLHSSTMRSTAAAAAAAAAATDVIDAVFPPVPASSSFFFPNDPSDPAVFAHQ